MGKLRKKYILVQLYDKFKTLYFYFHKPPTNKLIKSMVPLIFQSCDSSWQNNTSHFHFQEIKKHKSWHSGDLG